MGQEGGWHCCGRELGRGCANPVLASQGSLPLREAASGALTWIPLPASFEGSLELDPKCLQQQAKVGSGETGGRHVIFSFLSSSSSLFFFSRFILVVRICREKG